MRTGRKVVILGVDGGDPAHYRRWMEGGLTPNFARLARRGRRGVLRSTFPPVTAPAWISLMTGEQPGSHGVVGFAAPPSGNGEYTRRVVDSGSIESALLWEIAGRHGRRAIVVNVPLTYPIRPLNGILVSGMLTPEGAGFTHPPEYLPELRLLQPDYRIDLAWQDYRLRRHDLVTDQKAVTRARAELCVKLLEAKPWDLFVAVFTGPDRLQHCLHGHVARIHDDAAVRRDPLTAAVRDYFVSLDEWVGDILRAAGPDTDFLVVSDHGFGPREGSIHFNRWLAGEGLLSRAPERRVDLLRAGKRAMNALGVRRSRLTGWGRSLGLGERASGRIERLNPHVGGIDWSRTKVHYEPTNGFFVNLRGRNMFGIVAPGQEYEAVRDDLIHRLEALRDPGTGERLVPRIERREDLFAGRSLEKLPDVFIDFGDRPYDAFARDYDGDRFLVPSDWGDGTHRGDGLYIGAGPDLDPGSDVEGLEIFDIAPNVLHLLGCPIPAGMDGRFREDLFAPGLGAPEFEKGGSGPEERAGVSGEEQEGLESKLKGLGYL